MVDDNDGRTPDHGHLISSPWEPNGSGELIILNLSSLGMKTLSCCALCAGTILCSKKMTKSNQISCQADTVRLSIAS